jgi:FkbM family methyltransferase
VIIFNPHKTILAIEHYLPQKPTIVEAGAFDGNDTKKMSLRWPEGIIHAFEPVPEIYARLVANTSTHANIRYHQLALSNTSGTQLFYISERPTKPGIASQAGSLHKPKDRLAASPLIFPRTTMVQTITLQNWADNNNIQKIDLLWLDTQGHELAILQASEPFLKNVHAILAEVSFIESYHNQPHYHNVVDWLKKQGFEYVGRDFENTTTSFFGNALFVRP